MAASRVPDWASTYDEPLYKEFLGVVLREVEKRGHKGVEVLDGVKYAGKMRPLAELAEACRHMPPSHWPRAVAAHLKRVEGTEAEAEALMKRTDLKAARESLRIRLGAEKGPGEPKDTGCSKPVAPGLVATLVQDLPGGPQPVKAEMADGWGATSEALFEVARANHKRMKARVEEGQSFELKVLAGKTPDVASEILFLDQYVRMEPPAGSLVVVPNRQTLVWHEVRDKTVMNAIETMVVIAYQLFNEGPEPVIPVLYWYRRKRFALLPLEVQGQNVRFMPPIEFVTALKKVGVDLTE